MSELSVETRRGRVVIIMSHRDPVELRTTFSDVAIFTADTARRVAAGLITGADTLDAEARAALAKSLPELERSYACAEENLRVLARKIAEARTAAETGDA